MPTEFVMLPPQTERTREWGARLAPALPELKVIVAENHTHAAQVIAHADAAFGVIPPDLLRQAQRLRWLQAPQAAPPAGYYYPELIAHPVAITNFREIYNDHIGAHVMAFVLAFARGLHHYIPQQLKREWNKLPPDTTKVIIAHRLNTIDNVDQIYFVNSGGIALAGSMEHALDMLLHGKRES